MTSLPVWGPAPLWQCFCPACLINDLFTLLSWGEHPHLIPLTVEPPAPVRSSSPRLLNVGEFGTLTSQKLANSPKPKMLSRDLHWSVLMNYEREAMISYDDEMSCWRAARVVSSWSTQSIKLIAIGMTACRPSFVRPANAASWVVVVPEFSHPTWILQWGSTDCWELFVCIKS